MARHLKFALMISLMLGMATLPGCASSGGSSAESAAVNPYTAPPSRSPLSKVVMRSNEIAVRKAVGDPDDSTSYMTGKIFIPFYFGTDAFRTDWIYRGQGRITFSRGVWGDAFKVIAIKYNPNELK